MIPLNTTIFLSRAAYQRLAITGQLAEAAKQPATARPDQNGSLPCVEPGGEKGKPVDGGGDRCPAAFPGRRVLHRPRIYRLAALDSDACARWNQ
jgi:hypothetical protein